MKLSIKTGLLLSIGLVATTATSNELAIEEVVVTGTPIKQSEMASIDASAQRLMSLMQYLLIPSGAFQIKISRTRLDVCPESPLSETKVKRAT